MGHAVGGMLRQIIRLIQSAFDIILIFRKLAHERNHDMQILFRNVFEQYFSLLPFAYNGITSRLSETILQYFMLLRKHFRANKALFQMTRKSMLSEDGKIYS